MSFEYIRKMPTPEEIKKLIPMDKSLVEIKKKRDMEIRDIFEGKSDKLILIIGPCSADEENSVCEYVNRLGRVQEEVKDKLLLIPRIYTNKPRTTGEGYKGMLHQPNPNGESNMLEGLKAIRNLHLRVIRESHLTAADEMLYPTNYPYLDDLLSYIAVGARSVENQKHRLTVSGVDMPVGMKNPTSGDLSVMLNSIKAAQIAHNFIYGGNEVKTSGNPLAHAIVRGAVNQYGRNIPNYHYEDMTFLAKRYNERELANASIIVDANHANSKKMYEEQPRIAMEVIRNMQYSPVLRKMVKGLMIESYLEDGKQDVTGKIPGKSITDSCLGWEKTVKLINEIAEQL